MNSRIKQPLIKPIKNININEPEKLFFKNGIPAYIFKSEENILKIKFIFKAGNYYQEYPLQAYFTNKLLCEGTKNYSSKKIAEIFDYYGASLNLNIDDDNASVSMIVAKKDLSKLLPVMAELIINPIFPNSEFNTQKGITFQNFIISNEKVATIAKYDFLQTIFGNTNYYGYKTKAEDFNNLKIEALKTFHKKYYTPQNCFIIIAGNVNNHEINLIDSSFNDDLWKGKKVNTPAFIATPSENSIIHIEKKDALQSAIRIGKTMFNRTHKDDIGFRVLNMILGGYFGSRLMANVREEKGYTYGIYSSLFSLQQTGYFSVITEVGSPVCKDAIKEIYKEIAKLQEHKVGDEELALVKNYILGNFLRNIDGQQNYSNLFENIIIYGLDTKYLYKYLDEVQNIHSEKILSLARLYLNPEKLYEVTVG